MRKCDGVSRGLLRGVPGRQDPGRPSVLLQRVGASRDLPRAVATLLLRRSYTLRRDASRCSRSGSPVAVGATGRSA
jgi:hypothetical protein